MLPVAGDRLPRSITAADLDALYADLLRSGRRDDLGGLPARSGRNAHTVIGRVLADVGGPMTPKRGPHPPRSGGADVATCPHQVTYALADDRDDLTQATRVEPHRAGLRRNGPSPASGMATGPSPVRAMPHRLTGPHDTDGPIPPWPALTFTGRARRDRPPGPLPGVRSGR